VSRTVLVTGAAGFVGHRLVAALAAAGDHPHAVAHPTPLAGGYPTGAPLARGK
jgi:uncharacterized protein YbjT (DUF2867 family)